MVKILNFDLWNNIIELNYNGFSVKQTFNDTDIVKYEDSIGNYWDISIGIENPYPIFSMVDLNFNLNYNWGYSYYKEKNCYYVHITPIISSNNSISVNTSFHVGVDISTSDYDYNVFTIIAP